MLSVRPSKSRPDQGVIKVKTTTLNQSNEPVQVSVGNLLVRRRQLPRTRCWVGATRRTRPDRGADRNSGGSEDLFDPVNGAVGANLSSADGKGRFGRSTSVRQSRSAEPFE